MQASNCMRAMQVPTGGLLNTIGAPQLGAGSPYVALSTSAAAAPQAPVSMRRLLMVSALCDSLLLHTHPAVSLPMEMHQQTWACKSKHLRAQ